jgi:hypothetical protein
MNALEVAARFTALRWYQEMRPHRRQEAIRFSKTHWAAFLPYANPGLGRLLMRITRKRKTRSNGTPRLSQAV